MSRTIARVASFLIVTLLPLLSAAPEIVHAQATRPAASGLSASDNAGDTQDRDRSNQDSERVTSPEPSSSSAPRTARATIAYVPAAIWGRDVDAAVGELHLDAHAIYWFEGTDSMGRVIGDRERYEADDAKAAPREPLVAFVGRYSGAPTEPMAVGVAVMDTTGALIADFPHGQTYSWSPDGTRLAVVSPREALPQRKGRKGKVQYRPGVTVWNRTDGSVRSFAHWPTRAGWIGEDSLLLQLPDTVVVLDAEKGTVKPIKHRGTVISPDSRFAMWPGVGGLDTQLYDEESGAPITEAMFGPLQKGDRGQVRSAFWLRGRGSDHLMCGSACDAIQFQKPNCRTKVVDAESKKILASFPGEALGPTADERGVVVFHRTKGTLEFCDLRPVIKEHYETERGNEAKAREVAEAKAREDAELKAREAEVKAREEAEAKAREEADAKAREEAKAKEEREAKAKEEAEAKKKQEREEKKQREKEETDKEDSSGYF
jgi:hypothetical protein